MELNISDFKRLNENFKYIAKRKFDLELDNNLEDIVLSDILISLFFRFNRTKSKVAISIVGSYVGETIIKNWHGKWDSEKLCINKVGINKIVVNPFSIAHQRLTKGINKMLSYQLDLVSIKANNFEVYSNDNLKKDYIKGKVTKLYNDGWFDEFFNKIYNDDNKNYMKFEAAYLLGISLKYLQTNELDSKIKELFELKPYYASVVFQNYLIEENFIIDKLIDLLKNKDNNIKLQALLALVNAKKSENVNKIKQLLYDLLINNNTNDMIFLFYLGQAIGNFKDLDNINWIRNKLMDKDINDMAKLSLLVSIQSLKDSSFISDLLYLLLESDVNDVIKDEILKTLQYLPITQKDINSLLDKYHQYEPYQKIHILNALFLIDSSERLNILQNLLNVEKDPFVKSYIVSLIDQIV
ncbi:MAG: hypothetical protein N2485_07680 [bacterium]|nr:hypothetical protein [bacterium]